MLSKRVSQKVKYVTIFLPWEYIKAYSVYQKKKRDKLGSI